MEMRLSLALAALVVASALHAQSPAPTHGVRPGRLAIRNALVVEGNGTPTTGPWDILVEGNRIVAMVPLDPVAVKNGRQRRPAADAEIDATGKYVLPGLINIHAHLQNERGGIPQPYAYQFKLWLASGVTTSTRWPRAAGPPRRSGPRFGS
jgi:dihydroorotase-like cyclic amidohydrolase